MARNVRTTAIHEALSFPIRLYVWNLPSLSLARFFLIQNELRTMCAFNRWSFADKYFAGQNNFHKNFYKSNKLSFIFKTKMLKIANVYNKRYMIPTHFLHFPIWPIDKRAQFFRVFFINQFYYTALCATEKMPSLNTDGGWKLWQQYFISCYILIMFNHVSYTC